MYLSICRYYLYVVIALLLLFPAHAFAAILLKNQTAIDAFYLTREGKPLWIENTKLNKAGEELLNTLKLSWQNGLIPDSYHAGIIQEKLNEKYSALEIELLLTDGYIEYVRDLSGMRINARDIGLNPKYWRKRISADEALSFLPQKKIANFLLSREPQTKTYQRLKKELIRLYALDNRPTNKIEQIIVNMERLRWVDDKKPKRFIVVNIPSATLWAIDNGKVKFQMPVVVGRKERQTVPFITDIDGVRFNPSWTMPPTIKQNDILPKLQENENYLTGKEVELYDGYGNDAVTLDPTSIDWLSISKAELGKLRMTQLPGISNPLGRIKVLMPNEYDIYLHDTNDKSLFSQQNRARSSGCIRLQDAGKIALFILGSSNPRSEEIMQKALRDWETSDIYIQEKPRVYLLYYTTWIGAGGQVVYGLDIYNRDELLLQLLKKT